MCLDVFMHVCTYVCCVCVCYYFKKIQLLEENYVWDLVELLKNRRVAEREWVFRQKLGEYGVVKQYMATLVFKSYSQKFVLELCLGLQAQGNGLTASTKSSLPAC